MIAAANDPRPPELKVVRLKHQLIGNLGDLDYDLTKLIRAWLNGEVRNFIRSGGQLKALAVKANLATSTVSNLAYYETTRPQWRTVMGVVMALGALGAFAELLTRYAEAHQ